MTKQATRTELSSPISNDEESLCSDNQPNRLPNLSTKTDSIKQYVTNVLHRHADDDEQQTDLRETDINIDVEKTSRRTYKNISAFRQYHSHAEGSARTGAQRRLDDHLTSDDEIHDRPLSDQVRRCLLKYIKKSKTFLKTFQ